MTNSGDQNAVDGLQKLIDEVGHGDLQSKLIVDQAYAQAQHEELTWKHPHGGRAKYLEAPLMENSDELLQIMADHLIGLTGSDIKDGMIKVAEKMSTFVEDNAPKDIGVHELARSGHPMVYDDGVVIYDRAPKVPRVSN